MTTSGEPSVGLIKENKRNVRVVTIARRISDVLEDALDLKRKKSLPKNLNRKVLPPLTAHYRQTMALREIRELEEKLVEALKVCNERDVEKHQFLEKVIEKAEALRLRLQQAQIAFETFQEQKETHQKAMQDFDVTIKYLEDTLRRWVRCGEDLWELKQILMDVIDENECYKEFLHQVARSKNGDWIDLISDRYEETMEIQIGITARIEEKSSKAEKARDALAKMKDELITDLDVLVSELIDAHHESHRTKQANDKLDRAMKHISINSFERSLTLQRVHKSAEQMIENLIERKFVGKSFRKKTLAQQFEAIRADYIKKKAVIHAFEKSQRRRDARKARALQKAEEFEDEEILRERHQKRMDDLSKKKKVMKMKVDYDRHRKLMIHKGLLGEEEVEKEYNIFEDDRIILDVHANPTLTTTSDEEWDTDEDSKISLEKFSDEDNILMAADSDNNFLTTPTRPQKKKSGVSRANTVLLSCSDSLFSSSRSTMASSGISFMAANRGTSTYSQTADYRRTVTYDDGREQTDTSEKRSDDSRNVSFIPSDRNDRNVSTYDEGARRASERRKTMNIPFELRRRKTTKFGRESSPIGALDKVLFVDKDVIF